MGAEQEMNLRAVQITVSMAAVPLLLNKLYLLRLTQLKEGNIKTDQTAPSAVQKSEENQTLTVLTT